MTVREEALAGAIEAVPELLDQAVTLGRIDCAVALIIAGVVVGSGLWALRWRRQIRADGGGSEKEGVALAVAIIAFGGAALLLLIGAEGLLSSFAAPKAYAVRQLIGRPL